VNDSDPGRDEMTDAQLDQLLAAANSELLEHIEATTDPGQVLAAIMDQGARQDRPAASRDDPAQAFAAAMIRCRARASDLDRAISSARRIASTLGRDIDSDRDSGWDPAAFADDRVARNLVVARILASDLASDLASARTLAHFFGYANDLDYISDLASAVTDRLANIFRDPGGAAFVGYIGAGDAEARLITHNLVEWQVDASGADLSDIEIRQLGPLDGVIWTRETTWPPGAKAEVEAHSKEIRDGVYQVRLGDTRDRDPAQI
jgi:hypothetical protein